MKIENRTTTHADDQPIGPQGRSKKARKSEAPALQFSYNALTNRTQRMRGALRQRDSVAGAGIHDGTQCVDAPPRTTSPDGAIDPGQRVRERLPL